MELSSSMLLFVLAGWAVMVFAPSFFIALPVAAGFGVGAAYLAHLDLADPSQGDLLFMIRLIALPVGLAVLAAYPVAALFKWAVRKKTSGI